MGYYNFFRRLRAAFYFSWNAGFLGGYGFRSIFLQNLLGVVAGFHAGVFLEYAVEVPDALKAAFVGDAGDALRLVQQQVFGSFASVLVQKFLEGAAKGVIEASGKIVIFIA